MRLVGIITALVAGILLGFAWARVAYDVPDASGGMERFPPVTVDVSTIEHMNAARAELKALTEEIHRLVATAQPVTRVSADDEIATILKDMAVELQELSNLVRVGRPAGLPDLAMNENLPAVQSFRARLDANRPKVERELLFASPAKVLEILGRPTFVGQTERGGVHFVYMEDQREVLRIAIVEGMVIGVNR